MIFGPNPSIRILFACILIPVSPTFMMSQGMPISLHDAIRTALKKNNALVASRAEVDQADARVLEAWGYALPRVDFQGSYNRALKKPVFFLPDFENPESNRIIPIEIGSDHAFDFALSARQVLFDATVFVGVGSARIYSDASRKNHRAKEAEVVADARKAYYNVLVAKEIVAMTDEQFDNVGENLHNVRTMLAQGLLSEYDELRAEVALANMRPQVIDARNSLTTALNGLKLAMGIPFSEEIDVTDPLQFEHVHDSAIQHAPYRVLRDNPQLSAVRLQGEIADAIASVERTRYLPSLSIFGNYQWQAQKNTLRFSGNDFVGSAIVGLSLSWNIFTGLQTRARVEQAEYEKKKIAAQIHGLEQNLQTTVQSLVIQLRSATEKMDAQDKTVIRAERGYRIAVTRFASGAGTQLEVNDAQLALTQAKVNRIRSISDYLTIAADLDRLFGWVPDYEKEEGEHK